jgi:hypothetical protein
MKLNTKRRKMKSLGVEDQGVRGLIVETYEVNNEEETIK